MAQTCTTSIRLDEKLARQLEQAAMRLHRRKNGLIVRAIEEWLERHAGELLQDEAREQSLLASRLDEKSEADAWGGAHDDRGWRA